MPIPIGIIVSALEAATNERVHKAARGLWARTKWGRDAGKSALVDKKIESLLNDVRNLARSLAASDVAPAIERRVGGFERELKDAGLGDDVAREMTVGIRRQIDDAIVGPMRELKLLEERLNEVDRASTSAEAAVVRLEAEIARLRLWVYGAGVATFLSLFALLVALAVIRR